MGSYKQYITNDGEKLLIQALSGEELKFTRVATSTAEIASTDIRELIDLPDVKQTVIPAAATVGRNAIRIQSSFTNKDVTESYLVQAVGLYARIGDGQEVLFDIAVADDPCKVTVARASSIDTLVFNFNIAVQQADQITIAVAPGGSLSSEVFYKMFPGMTAPSTEKAGNILMVSETGKWEYIEPDDELSETSKNPVQNKVVTEELKKKQNAIQGKGLSTNDFTDGEKQKLHDIDSGANKTIVDSVLSSTSTNPIQNQAVNAAIENLSKAIEQANQLITNLQALRASPTTYGMVKVTDSAVVTDSTGMALAATEKNATIQGTLAQKIAQLNTDLIYSLKDYPSLGENYIMNAFDFTRFGLYHIASLSEADEKNYPHPYNVGYYHVLCVSDNCAWQVLLLFSPRLFFDNKMHFYIGYFANCEFMGWSLFSSGTYN